MLKIHQPYKRKSKYILAFSSTGVFLLGSLWFGCRLWELSSDAKQILSRNFASAAGDYRTIHDIENMQEMTQQVCSNTDEGDTATLKDTRDPNSYTVVKLKDGNCWMQQNLRLKLTKNTAIEGSKTDGTAYSWTVPNLDTATTQAYSTSGTWISDNTVVMSRAGSGTNGTYYTWCAATAGTCSGATSDGQVASASICPKGWHLPTGSTNGEFYNLFGANGINLGGTSSNTSTDYQTRFDNIKASPYMFPAAGYVGSNGSLYLEGSLGVYWSSTASSGTNAYRLYFNSSNFYPGTNGYDVVRWSGFSVRCVTSGGLDKIEKPIWTETADTGINVTVPKIITLDVSDGMNATADAYKVVTGEIVATVTSNNIEYQVLLSSDRPNLIGQKDSSNFIAPVSDTNPVEKGNNAWGILNASNLYDPITTTPQQFYNTTTSNDKSTSHTYGVGISISPTLPADTYSTTVTVTASSK